MVERVPVDSGRFMLIAARSLSEGCRGERPACGCPVLETKTGGEAEKQVSRRGAKRLRGDGLIP
jgi:hypothetical protein